MEKNDLLIKCAFFMIACIAVTVIGETYAKEFEGVLKLAFASGYGALAWEASRQERIAEALICNFMMAIYLTAALNHGFPNLGERIEFAWNWMMIHLPPKAMAMPYAQ